MCRECGEVLIQIPETYEKARRRPQGIKEYYKTGTTGRIRSKKVVAK